MQVHCPNCKKLIDLVGSHELREDYSISTNKLQHEREMGRLPEPYMTFNNRHIWLRGDVEEFIEQRSRDKVEKTVSELLSALDNLPPDEREAARDLLVAGTPDGRRRAKAARKSPHPAHH
jgi:hypothetical protein